MKWLLILAVFTDNGLSSSVRERTLGAYDTLAECRSLGHVALVGAAEMLRGDVRRIELYCELRGGGEVFVGRRGAR